MIFSRGEKWHEAIEADAQDEAADDDNLLSSFLKALGDDSDEDFDDDDYDEEGFDFGDEDSTIYEVECPVCGEVINFDEDTLEGGAIPCPNCGENLEFDFEDEE